MRPKMSCRACETIVQAPMPTLPIEKGRPGPALLAHVIVSKYCDHLPLHRQSGIYAREGVTIDEAGARLHANAERHLKGVAEMRALFPDLRGAIDSARSSAPSPASCRSKA